MVCVCVCACVLVVVKWWVGVEVWWWHGGWGQVRRRSLMGVGYAAFRNLTKSVDVSEWVGPGVVGKGSFLHALELAQIPSTQASRLLRLPLPLHECMPTAAHAAPAPAAPQRYRYCLIVDEPPPPLLPACAC